MAWIVVERSPCATHGAKQVHRDSMEYGRWMCVKMMLCSVQMLWL